MAAPASGQGPVHPDAGARILVHRDTGEVIALRREEAACLRDGTGKTAYDALLDDYEPGASALGIAEVFGEIRPRLVALREAIRAEDERERATKARDDSTERSGKASRGAGGGETKGKKKKGRPDKRYVPVVKKERERGEREYESAPGSRRHSVERERERGTGSGSSSRKSTRSWSRPSRFLRVSLLASARRRQQRPFRLSLIDRRSVLKSSSCLAGHAGSVRLFVLFICIA